MFKKKLYLWTKCSYSPGVRLVSMEDHQGTYDAKENAKVVAYMFNNNNPCTTNEIIYEKIADTLLKLFKEHSDLIDKDFIVGHIRCAINELERGI